MQSMCKKCGNKTYDDEPDCPHCGMAYEGVSKPKGNSGQLLWFFFLFVLIYGAKALVVDMR
jgi:hypothetical protein